MLKTVAIVGAGQMGSGIAHVAALAGYDVLLEDINSDQLVKALETIEAQFSKQCASGRIDERQKNEAYARIKTVTQLEALCHADLVIEAAREEENIKRDIFIDLCKTLKKEALLATNTSTISITRLAATTDRPEKFIGVHFMNPVAAMKLVEVVRGIATSEDTFQTIGVFLQSLDKTYTVSQDFPAFIVNRVLLPMINEAVYTLYEGVGTVDAIDTALKLGANHPMGPLQLADFIGLDVCLAGLQVLANGLSDTKYRPCPLLIKYVEAGWLGQKTGKGFYDYSGVEPVPSR